MDSVDGKGSSWTIDKSLACLHQPNITILHMSTVFWIAPSLFWEHILHAGLNWSGLVCVWKTMRMREDSFDSDHRSCSLYTDLLLLSYNGYRGDLGKKTDLSTRKALSDQIMLALANHEQ